MLEKNPFLDIIILHLKIKPVSPVLPTYPNDMRYKQLVTTVRLQTAAQCYFTGHYPQILIKTAVQIADFDAE